MPEVQQRFYQRKTLIVPQAINSMGTKLFRCRRMKFSWNTLITFINPI
ncbi:hypothetical protein Xentx_02876 [Xenorhabdus thuongxuanensis]|uniref:Uncharacterized protein n=1 Tax=Xenorhabdus thuongxuanensis TaxID=1873484 RepID=A0A1Q5TU45_9GAMM|nr:hypothetical protein Xentx_02876 [Xenorhabdus thuongxuanensis]